MTTSFFLDSNIFVYAFDQTSEKHLTAVETIASVSEKIQPTTSIQNIAEFARVVTEKLPIKMKSEEAQREANRIKQMCKVLYYNVDAIVDALSISKFYNIHFFDALIAATMRQHQLDTIVTANEKDFKKVPGIKVVNPFKK